MVHIAILGNGVVGSGVSEVIAGDNGRISKNAGDKVHVKYILERKDYPEELRTPNMVFDYDVILDDNEVDIVVEVIGGTEPSYTFVKKALMAGKSVVTSNKALVAEHGKELLQIAYENNVNFLIGASVGGGIPVIRPMNVSLTADTIEGIEGILNGTTNFILSQMYENDMEFDEALKQAQQNGYAELNPEADVLGHDTARKIAILLSLATGKFADYKEISCKGITEVTKKDMELAKSLHCDIKLVAWAKIEEDCAYAFVCPAFVKKEHPLNNIRDVFNGVLIKGKVTGDVMFYGRGAGKLPTASAVVADVIDCIKNKNTQILTPWEEKPLDIRNLDELAIKEIIGVYGEANDILKQVFGDISFEIVNDSQIAFITPLMKKKEIDEKIEEIKGKGIKILCRMPVI